MFLVMEASTGLCEAHQCEDLNMYDLCKTPSIEGALLSPFCIGALLGVLRLLEDSTGVWKNPYM